MTTFGDWEPADSYVPDNVPDPLQVANRIHELRIGLNELVGNETEPRWAKLTEEQREVALFVVIELLAWLRMEGTRL